MPKRDPGCLSLTRLEASAVGVVEDVGELATGPQVHRLAGLDVVPFKLRSREATLGYYCACLGTECYHLLNALDRSRALLENDGRMHKMLDAATASWQDVDAAIRNGLIAVLPVGAVEQHGAHLPLLTDTVLATGVARRIAIDIRALLLPAIAYGDAWTAEGWAGTLSLSPNTLRAMIEDIGRGLHRMGVEGLITVNGHFGNREPIALAARAMSEINFPILHLDYPRLEQIAADIVESAPAAPGFYHADEVETSMMLALSTNSVKMEKALHEYPKFPELFGSAPTKLSAFNSSGVFGDPRRATAAKGELLVTAIVEESLRLAGLWRKEKGLR